MHLRRRKTLWILALLAVATILAGPVVAASERLVTLPPELHLRLGTVRLAGFITDRPECREVLRARTPHPVCTHGAPLAIRRYYAVWMVVQSESAGVPREEHRRMLLLPLRQVEDSR